MPNDYLSLWSSPRRSARLFEGTTKLADCARWSVFAVLACFALPGCGGEEDDGITYADDVQPLFNRRCTTCHYSSTPIGVDIQNPFAPERGLVNSVNSWDVEHPEENLPERNVVAFEPENSFLMAKLTDELPVNGFGGSPMPLQVSPVDAEELALLEQWVTEGAQDNALFRDSIRPIFGSESSAGAYYGGKCIFCHYEGSPNPLDLSNPFGPNGLVRMGPSGLVGVNARYRGDMVRVLPGDPEQSLLILKVRAEQPGSDIGAQMPYSYNPLTPSQVDVVRQWIVEGARP
jgi:hypothetical protein